MLKLTREQINWRRWTIVNNCTGNLLKFKQEYPISDTEAFLATGDIYFDRNGLLKQLPAASVTGNFVLFEQKMVFRETFNGLWRIYEPKKEQEQYCIGGDPAEGLPKGDYSGGVVLNKRTNDTVAVYRHRSAPDQFAVDLVNGAKFFNNAMVACENKGYGASVNHDMHNIYGNLFRMTKNGKFSVEYGWNTNVTSRRTMLAQLDEEIREEATELRDPDLIGECWTFICNPNRNGEPEADGSKTDDLVMARAIAGQVIINYPYVKRVDKRSREHSVSKPNQGYDFSEE